MDAGIRFTLHGIAVVSGRVRLFVETREGTGDNLGSRSLGRKMLQEPSWPNTRNGQRAGAEETARLNTIESRRLAEERNAH